ncbi:MAG TPA: hypothetical protein VK195_14465, partial [Burkholderiaceae bacterium]|nr:hypothetical protein [Burkholderiaceae bacterium]
MNAPSVSRLCRRALLAVLLPGWVASTPLHAQQSTSQALDQCIRGQQRGSGLVGGLLGALGGLGVHLGRSGEDRSREHGGVSVSLGAGAGGALGLASAYFNAVGTCFKKHPEWIPESRLERGQDYETLLRETDYRPEQGLLARSTQVDMPTQARPDSAVEVRSRFILLTPDGAEAPVQIERLLFAIVEGQESALPLPAQAQEQRVLPPGEHLDRVRLPIPKDAPLGTV